MSELRKDPIVERWVIITDDAVRTPNIRPLKDAKNELLCPFCPGNEHLCPPEILANRPSESQANDASWQLRVVPNRTPLVVVEEELRRLGEGLYDKVTGVGANEVIIETPRHGIRQAEMEIRELENIFWAYRDRIIDLRKDVRLRTVLITRDARADALICHPHSVLTALPIIPRTIQEEVEGGHRHFVYKERCIWCDIIRQELQQEVRVVSETRHYLAVEPFAPRVPFETWILPKRHAHRFDETEPVEIHELAAVFQEILRRLDRALAQPDYRYVLHTAPLGEECEDFYHWHLELLPRVADGYGFDWGSGMFVNATPPEEAARFLRAIAHET